MSLRAVWAYNLSKDDFGNNLLFKHFPTVEKRCKLKYRDLYTPIPNPALFGNNLIVKLGLSPDSKQFVELRDKACRILQLPVLEVEANKQELWPVLAIVQQSLIVCCLPFVENLIEVDRSNLLQVPSVSIGFAVLLGIHNFLSTQSTPDKQKRFIELQNYLNLSMPFGVPSDVEVSCATYMLKPASQKLMKRQPAWKPLEHQGKQLISIQINEFIRCVQSNQTKTQPQLQVYGQISVKAEVEGTTTDVTLSVSPSGGQPLSLDSVIVHPCVDVHGGLTSLSFPKRVRFTPPLHEFTLLQYCSSHPKDPPISGLYRMVGENPIELLIKLKLNDIMRNSFEYCEVLLVFFNRGPVKDSTLSATYGSPRLSDDKYTLKWNIGTKFPKDMEVMLSAKLEFLPEPILPNSDPFCVDKNSFMQINFKQNNSTLSGCSVDPKTVTVSEGGKAKVTVDRSVQTTEYRIWNVFGDVPFPENICSKFEELHL